MAIWTDNYEPIPKEPRFYKRRKVSFGSPGQYLWQRVIKKGWWILSIWWPVGESFLDWETCFKKVEK